MSKSIGNIVNIKDLLKERDPEVIRFFFAQAHYRSPPDFSENALNNAQKGLLRIRRFKEKLETMSKSTSNNLNKDKLTDDEKQYLNVINDFENDFVINMDDDFNTPGAVANIFDFVNKSNKFFNDYPNPNQSLCKYALDVFLRLGNILTLFQEKEIVEDTTSIDKLHNLLFNYNEKIDSNDLNELMEKILSIRTKARMEKNWNVSDNIREELNKIGFEIQDTDSGPIWRKK
jgi:cysteinyl-tRNA synthetase